MTNYPQNHVDIPTAPVDNNFAPPKTGQQTMIDDVMIFCKKQ